MAIRVMDAMDPQTEKALTSDAVLRNLPRHRWLFYEGDRTDDAYLVLSGLLKLMKTASDGSEVMLAIRGAGDVVGELSALDGRPRLVSAVAMTETSLFRIRRERLTAVMAERPDLAMVLLSNLTGQLRSVASQALVIASGDSTALVARRLFQLASDRRFEPLRSRVSDVVAVDMPISQRELATWAGVSLRSTVAALSQLRGDGIITTSRLHFEVLDIEILRSRAGQLVAMEPN